MFYTDGFKTENETATIIFVFNSNQYQYYKHQMTYQNIICFDNEKIMEKNWNLKKIAFNNIAELFVIWKILIWILKIFQSTEKTLNQEIWIFSDSQIAFNAIKNTHSTGITRDIRKNIKIMKKMGFFINLQ